MKLTHHDLEKVVHQSLRELPSRQAPPGFGARVLAEVARRQGLPWWQKSFGEWPAGVRAAFLLLSAASAAALVAALVRLGPGAGPAALVGSVVARWDGWVLLQALARESRETGAAIVGAIPSLYLYGALAFIAACYAAIVGVGAAAYRLLFFRA